MAERCINLTAAEARAWTAGATCLIRRAKMDICTYREHDGPKTYYDPAMPSWDEGDVLIGREAWAKAWAKELLPGERIGKTAAQCAAENGGFACAVCDGVVYRADSPAHDDQRCWWRSPATMPKALARHRRRVVSVRVCRVKYVEAHEWAEAGIDPFDSAFAPNGRCDPASWVSVTTTEAADVR